MQDWSMFTRKLDSTPAFPLILNCAGLERSMWVKVWGCASSWAVHRVNRGWTDWSENMISLNYWSAAHLKFLKDRKSFGRLALISCSILRFWQNWHAALKVVFSITGIEDLAQSMKLSYVSMLVGQFSFWSELSFLVSRSDKFREACSNSPVLVSL